jgi:hypothetical protein
MTALPPLPRPRSTLIALFTYTDVMRALGSAVYRSALRIVSKSTTIWAALSPNIVLPPVDDRP